MLAKQGLSVLLWDLDPQGGGSFFFNRQNQNNNTHAKLFDRYITIYEVIQPTDSYQIDIIANDAFFSDQFLSKASRITALNFTNHDLIRLTLEEVEEDYDVCILDCSPGRFLLHSNIFAAADLLLIPNIPAPLSVYCNNMLLEELLRTNPASAKKMLCFYNMVQANKTLHKYYLDARQTAPGVMLQSYIPFYAEIESITLKKEYIFHQLKAFKTNVYYEQLWSEICGLLHWPTLNKLQTPVVDIAKDALHKTPEVVQMEQQGFGAGKVNG